jgi:transposase
MILLNFSHPITGPQRGQIEALIGNHQSITRELAALPQFDEQQPFGPQVQALLDEIDLLPAQWQGEPILVVLPSLNFIAAALLAELHGRMGYFPPAVRTKPVAGVVPRQFEVAEILDLQAIREAARKSR